MSEAPDPDSAALVDATRLRAVVAALGAARTREFLSLIEARLAAVADGTGSPRERVAEVHRCAGSAASLGLVALEAELRALELGLSAGEALGADAMTRLQATYAASLPGVTRAAPALADDAGLGAP